MGVKLWTTIWTAEGGVRTIPEGEGCHDRIDRVRLSRAHRAARRRPTDHTRRRWMGLLRGIRVRWAQVDPHRTDKPRAHCGRVPDSGAPRELSTSGQASQDSSVRSEDGTRPEKEGAGLTPRTALSCGERPVVDLYRTAPGQQTFIHQIPALPD